MGYLQHHESSVQDILQSTIEAQSVSERGLTNLAQLSRTLQEPPSRSERFIRRSS